MKKYRVLPLLFIALLGLMAFPALPTFAQPYLGDAMYVSPALVNATALGLGLGDPFDVFIHINITDGAGMFGYEFSCSGTTH
jgi:predicted MFS family arabinose efflux permease